MSQPVMRMHSDAESALPDTSSRDFAGTVTLQGSAQYSAELKDMPEAPNKRRGHRRSVSQPTDMATFSQPQKCGEQEEQQWSQLEQGTAVAGNIGGTAFALGNSRVDRKGASRPPATAALAAIVAGAPLAGPDAAQGLQLESHSLGAEKEDIEKQIKNLEQEIQQRDGLNSRMK
eukprot:gene18158-21634_t